MLPSNFPNTVIDNAESSSWDYNPFPWGDLNSCRNKWMVCNLDKLHPVRLIHAGHNYIRHKLSLKAENFSVLKHVWRGCFNAKQICLLQKVTFSSEACTHGCCQCSLAQCPSSAGYLPGQRPLAPLCPAAWWRPSAARLCSAPSTLPGPVAAASCWLSPPWPVECKSLI